MNVQIFISEDNKALIYDNDQLTEFKSLVDELGLQCNNHLDSEKSPIPYMWLDQSTIRAFKLLCPSVDKVENYRLEIPIEILRNIKLSVHEKYFDHIEIWSNTKDPDPFCVGRVYKSDTDRLNGYTWNLQNYLIGRWGAEAKEMHELVEMATKIATDRIAMYAESTIAKLESWRKCPETWAKNYIFNDNSEASHAIQNSNSLLF